MNPRISHIPFVPVMPSLGFGYEPEMLRYLALGPTITAAEITTLNANIRAVKYSTGVTLASVTAKLSLVSGAYFITQSSVDLRPYALISGVQFNVSDGSKAAVFSGAMIAGTGETYVDIVTGDNSTFASDTGWWAKGANWSIGSGVASHSGAGSENLSKEGLASEVVGGLYCGGLDLTFSSGSYCRMFFAGTSLFGNQTVSATYSGYKTGTGITGLYIPYGVGFVGCIDNVILRRITAPDTTGFTSAALTDAGIAPNSASFTVTITKP